MPAALDLVSLSVFSCQSEAEESQNSRQLLLTGVVG
jgi:hypothetical protein